jgi:hypothetical protein
MSPTRTGETVKHHGRRIGRRRALAVGAALLPPVLLVSSMLTGCGSGGNNAGAKAPTGTSSPATPRGTHSPTPKTTHSAEPKSSGTSPTRVAAPSQALLLRFQTLFGNLSGPDITSSPPTVEANGTVCTTKVEGAGTESQRADILCIIGNGAVTQFGSDVLTPGAGGGTTEVIRGMYSMAGGWLLSARTVESTAAGTPKPNGVILQNNLSPAAVEAAFVSTAASMSSGS